MQRGDTLQVNLIDSHMSDGCFFPLGFTNEVLLVLNDIETA